MIKKFVQMVKKFVDKVFFEETVTPQEEVNVPETTPTVFSDNVVNFYDYYEPQKSHNEVQSVFEEEVEQYVQPKRERPKMTWQQFKKYNQEVNSYLERNTIRTSS